MAALINRCGFNTKTLHCGVLVSLLNGPNYQSQNRTASTKHWNPKFKKLRAQKFIKIELPNFHEKPEDVSEDERKRRMKERGIMPPRPWMERPFILTTTSAIFEPYIPPEGDGKMSTFSKAGAKQKVEFMEKKSKSMLAVRKIRNYEEDYDPVQFAQTAQDIYVRAHEALAAKDKDKLIGLVTERAYPEMTYNIERNTIHWQFLKSLEPPRTVQARCTNLVTKDNLFAQITVRFHTQQKLAIYDRFGRLMHGSEILAKDVLEYVIFEKNISNEYGIWRLHHKIIPDWAEAKEPPRRTYRVNDNEENENEGDKSDVIPQQDAVESVQIESGTNKPQLATA